MLCSLSLAFLLACTGEHSTSTPKSPGAEDEGGSGNGDTDSGRDDTDSGGEELPVDADGDGWPEEEDCDETDAAVHPGAAELCDDQDNDCDAEIDEEPLDGYTWHRDADGDGFGDAAAPVLHCAEEPEPGRVGNRDDCDDTDAAVYPGAPDEEGDGLDHDCNGEDGACAEGVRMALAEAEAVFQAEEGMTGTGCDVAGVGDLNGDRVADIGIAACTSNSDLDEEESRVYLLHGPVEGEIPLGTANGILHGEQSRSLVHRLAGPGDLDGDGYDDLLVGDRAYKYWDTIIRGRSYVLHGPITGDFSLGEADVVLESSLSESGNGQDIAGPGDVNGDGLPDLLISADLAWTPSEGSGAVFLLTELPEGGGAINLADAAAARILGTEEWMYVGGVITGPGDLDGDGLADVIVSAQIGPSSVAHLFHGPLEGDLAPEDADAFLHPEAPTENYRDMKGAGDFDGDGYRDIIVGMPNYNYPGNTNGAAYVISGSLSGTHSMAEAGFKLIGLPGTAIGWPVAGPGDLDGDGHDDIAVGAPLDDRWGESGGVANGAAYIVFGPASGVVSASCANVVLQGSFQEYTMSWSLAGAGDINADGRADLLVGQSWAYSATGDGGEAWLVLGGGW